MGRARVRKLDGTAPKKASPKIGTTAAVDPEFNLVDGWNNALIKSITLTVCHNVVSESTGSDYFYRNLLVKIMNFGEGVSNSLLKGIGYHEPINLPSGLTTKDHHTLNKLDHLKEEAIRFSQGEWLNFSTLLMLPEFLTDRDWPPGIDFELSIARQPDSFIFLTAGEELDHALELEDLCLEYFKVQPSQTLLKSNDERLKTQPATYQFCGWKHVVHKIPKTTKHHFTAPLFAGVVPAKTFYMLVPLKQYLGHHKYNPTVLAPHSLRKLVQYINGLKSPLEFDFNWTHPDYSQGYRRVLDAIAPALSGQGTGLTFKEFAVNRFIIAAVNVAHSIGISDPFREKPQLGSVHVELVFDKELTEDMVLLAFGLSDQSYGVNYSRELIHDPPVY